MGGVLPVLRPREVGPTVHREEEDEEDEQGQDGGADEGSAHGTARTRRLGPQRRGRLSDRERVLLVHVDGGGVREVVAGLGGELGRR